MSKAVYASKGVSVYINAPDLAELVRTGVIVVPILIDSDTSIGYIVLSLDHDTTAANLGALIETEDAIYKRAVNAAREQLARSKWLESEEV